MGPPLAAPASNYVTDAKELVEAFIKGERLAPNSRLDDLLKKLHISTSSLRVKADKVTRIIEWLEETGADCTRYRDHMAAKAFANKTHPKPPRPQIPPIAVPPQTQATIVPTDHSSAAAPASVVAAATAAVHRPSVAGNGGGDDSNGSANAHAQPPAAQDQQQPPRRPSVASTTSTRSNGSWLSRLCCGSIDAVIAAEVPSERPPRVGAPPAPTANAISTASQPAAYAPTSPHRPSTWYDDCRSHWRSTGMWPRHVVALGTSPKHVTPVQLVLSGYWEPSGNPTMQQLHDALRLCGKPPPASSTATTKEALWTQLVLAVQDRRETLMQQRQAAVETAQLQRHPDPTAASMAAVPQSAIEVLCQRQGDPGCSVDRLRLACIDCGCSDTGSAVDLWDRLEARFGLITTVPGHRDDRTWPVNLLHIQPPSARAACIIAGQMWWCRQGYRGDEAFPSEFAWPASSDSHCRHWRYDDAHIRAMVEGGHATLPQLEAMFPVIVKGQHRERVPDPKASGAWTGDQAGFTTNPAVRAKVWSDLQWVQPTADLVRLFGGALHPPPATTPSPPELLDGAPGNRNSKQRNAASRRVKEQDDEYRCDVYGNVIAIQAANWSLCRFDVDHCFPWSRGGLSVIENARALHSAANRNGKRAKLLVRPEDMATGLNAAAFCALFKAVKEHVSIRNRLPIDIDASVVLGATWADFRCLTNRPLRLQSTNSTDAKYCTSWGAFLTSCGQQLASCDYGKAVMALYVCTRELESPRWSPRPAAAGPVITTTCTPAEFTPYKQRAYDAAAANQVLVVNPTDVRAVSGAPAVPPNPGTVSPGNDNGDDAGLDVAEIDVSEGDIDTAPNSDDDDDDDQGIGWRPLPRLPSSLPPRIRLSLLAAQRAPGR